MKRVGFASISLVGSLWAAGAQAQEPTAPPAPPPAPPTAAPAAAAPAAAPAAPTPAPAAPAAASATPAPAVSASGTASLDTGLEDDVEGLETNDEPAEPSDYERRWRKASLNVQNSISGSTGLLHTSEAGSGAPGTFRISLLGSYFTSSGYLCNASSVCPVPGSPGATSPADDEVDGMGTHLALNATILPFLEGYLGFHNRAITNTRGRPQLLQVLGDTNLGVKAFMPKSPDSIFSVGGELELWLLNGTGGLGLDGGGTGFVARALGTIDLNNRVNAADNIPLRFHANLAYKLDNSGQIVSGLENNAPPVGRGTKISRLERFGLGINRVDFVSMAFAAEFDHPLIRPFLEWSLDIPLNRQDYTCNLDDVKLAGEGCLGEHQGFGSSPSRLSLGARVFPWVDHGLALLGAFDIGTGATSEFVEEVAPEPPWNLWFGVAYAVDTVPPAPVIKRVEKPAPPAPVAAHHAYLTGVVTERGTQAPIGGATLRYDGRNITGMVAGDDGTFRSTDLEPGTYTLNVKAQGYRDGQCVATVPAPGVAAPPAPAAASAEPGAPPAPTAPTPPAVSTPGGVAATVTAGGDTVVNVICELEGMPKVGTIVGAVSDGETGMAITGARITVTDPLNRSLDLSADPSGGFSVGNVKPGTVKLSVEAAGYFTSAIEVQVEARKEVQARIALNKRPTVPNVVVAGREVKLKKEVHFQHDSTEILPDSFGLLEELAELFKNKPDIRLAEVQGHTDNTGSPVYNQRLSQGRAQAVVDTLVRLGVSPDRLVAKGYGADKPLVPNSTDANRAKNRRVQVMIQQK